nr:metal/formaldehyde-sensitive transcriptional repressor [Bdellovibrio sp. HAGR004]
MHTIRDKKKVITRIKRIQGQLSALQNSIEAEEDDCYKVMQLLASCRGALNGLMGDIVNGHIKDHIVLASNKQDAAEAGDELIQVLGSFLK